jgi:hypothetical protein
MKEPVTVPANKLFPDADPSITMNITIPDGTSFNDGITTSDLLAWENYKHHFAKDWSAYKLGETSMRALGHLDKNSNAKSSTKSSIDYTQFPVVGKSRPSTWRPR